MQQIIANKISKKYGHSVIFRELEAQIEPGVHGIAGPNGSGKSTLMKCLSGLIRPDRGEVEWHLNGKKAERAQLNRLLGFSAPYIRLYDALTCSENLELICELTNFSEGTGRTGEVLESVGLGGKQDQFYGKLSSGQQQRLRIAASVIKSPKFLLLDEPGTNLDKEGFAMLQQTVQQCREQGMLVVIASNESRELDLCTRITDLNDFR